MTHEQQQSQTVTDTTSREMSGFLNIMKRMFEPVMDMKMVVVIGFLVMMNRQLFDFITIVATKYVGDIIQSGEYNLLPTMLVGYTIYYVVYYIVKFATRKKAAVYIRYTLAEILWPRMYTKFFAMNISATEHIGTGKMINILSKGVQSWRDSVTSMVYMASDIVVKLMMVVFLLHQLARWYTAIFIVLFVVISQISSRIYTYKVHPLRVIKKEVGVENSRQFVRMIMSKVEILQSDKILDEISTYVGGVTKQKEIAFANITNVFRLFNIPVIVVGSFFPLILIYVIVSLQDGTFSYGTFAAMSVGAGTLGQFLLKMTQNYKTILDDYVHIDKLWKMFDEHPVMKGYDEGNMYIYQTGSYTLKNISFAYSGGVSVFDDFSLEIAGGSKIALVGPSGSGKSTLVKLIAGYLVPDSGDIYIDEQNLSDISLKSYYQHIGYLTQEPSVFDGTVRENLEYGMTDSLEQTPTLKGPFPLSGENESGVVVGSSLIREVASMTKSEDGGGFATDNQCVEIKANLLHQAIINAKCEFVYDLPEGLDTEIGEKGVRLSGGQRQRLAIAKIFLKNPEIVILDEPTSALDSESEEAVTQAMNRLFEGRTVLIIAHRLQTVKHADKILYLDDGVVVEEGTHDELMKREGKYFRMVELQSGF